MRKLNAILIVTTTLLLVAMGVTVWQLMAYASKGSVSELTPQSIGLGLPDVRGEQNESGVRSASAVVWDSHHQSIVFEKDAFARRPIASLTKLMTAMVALDHGIEWDTPIEILPEENVIGGKLLLHPGEYVTMRDLFHASLMGSANNATLAYVRAMNLDTAEFVREMNRKAIAMNLEQTNFVDVTGLSPSNVSTAYEVARMAETALHDYPEIAEATSLDEYSYATGGSGRQHTVRNTNKLISEYGIDLAGGKTGFLYESLFCLVSAYDDSGGRHIAVVLGGQNEWDAMWDVRKLLNI